MRLKKSFKLAWNVFFLLTALCFSGIAIMVMFFGDTVNQIGQTRVENYVSGYKVQVEQAMQDLKNNDSQAVQDLLQGDLAGIKKGDSLYPEKRQLLLTLVNFLKSQPIDLSWIDWAKRWFKLDPKDITAMAYYYAALMQSDKEYEQGFNGLKDAQQNFPDHQLLKQFYHSAIKSAEKAKN